MNCKECITYIMCRNQLIEKYNNSQFSMFGVAAYILSKKCWRIQELMDNRKSSIASVIKNEFNIKIKDGKAE